MSFCCRERLCAIRFFPFFFDGLCRDGDMVVFGIQSMIGSVVGQIEHKLLEKSIFRYKGRVRVLGVRGQKYSECSMVLYEVLCSICSHRLTIRVSADDHSLGRLELELQ